MLILILEPLGFETLKSKSGQTTRDSLDGISSGVFVSGFWAGDPLVHGGVLGLCNPFPWGIGLRMRLKMSFNVEACNVRDNLERIAGWRPRLVATRHLNGLSVAGRCPDLP